MDGSCRIWNIRPFVAGDNNDIMTHTQANQHRCEHVLSGVHHGAEKLLLKCNWSYDGEYISAGSADR